MVESGIPGFDISNWFAYFVPAGTPGEIIARLNGEVIKALKFQDVKDKLASVGAETVGTTPDELGKFVQAETEKFAKLIKASGAKGTD
jgi:tripartite-type tricarboxylate transporter receptor subunit TctC